MPRTMTEDFSGGVVTARVGALLDKGELQRADDCFYREKDPAIWRAPGRTQLTASALGTDIRGIGHLSFDTGFTDQFVMLTRRTDGSPTWQSGPDTVYPGFHLYGCDFTAVSGLAPTEIGGQGQWFGVVSGSTTLDTQQSIASITISGTTLTGSANSFTNVAVGSVIAFVSGTGSITAGTRVLSVDSDTQITMTASGGAGTATLSFTQYPFLATAVGARIIGTNIGTNVRITAVSNQDGTTGHYRTATLTSAPSGGNGNYTFIATFGTSFDWNNTGNELLDYIQYSARKYYIWDGVGGLKCIEWKNRASLSDATLTDVLGIRPVGLKPVETPFSLTVQTGQSTGWNQIKGAGKYWFLITEIFSPNADIAAALKDPVQRTQIVESAYLAADNSSTTTDNGSQGGVGLPIGATIVTPASDNILLTFPAVTNNGRDGYVATHWGIYIYGPASDMPSLAQMRRCATPPITTMAAGATYLLTDSVLTQLQYPTGGIAIGGRPTFGHFDYMIGPPDGKDGYTKVGGSHKSIPDNAAVRMTGYNFSTSGTYSGKTPFGIEVQVTGRCNPSGDTTHAARYWFRVTTSGGKSTDTYYGEFGGQDNHTNRHGGPMDTMGVAWAASDAPLIQIEFGIANRGHKDELDIDAIGVKIYYTTTNVDFNGPAYRVVTYRDQVGLTVSDPARLLPPSPSTGDFFQGCLVLNNLGQENQIRYSLPGDPEAWPKPYELTFNTRRRDKVTFIRALNGILIVGMDSSIKRVNYLPRETDTDMNSGLAHEDIATDHGIPGPFCAAKFDMPGRGIMLAYASTVGMFLTNGIWTIPLNMDLDWANTVKISALSTSILRVYPKEKVLAFYFCPAGATHNKNTRVMYFCYQADKLKGEAQMPMIGPSVVSARSSCEAYLNNTPYIFTGHESNGLVYVEDSGIAVPNGYQVRLNNDSANGDGKTQAATDVNICPLIRTRKFYPITMDRDGFGEKTYLMFSPYGSSFTVASVNLTKDATSITKTGAFGSVTPGMRVVGTGVDGGTIVLTATADTITLSRALNQTVTGVTLTFDTGTLGVTVRGSTLGEAVRGLSHDYVSTLNGDVVSFNRTNFRRGFELQIEKCPLTFDANGDTLTVIDMNVNMRIHTFTYVVTDAGFPDSSRNDT